MCTTKWGWGGSGKRALELLPGRGQLGRCRARHAALENQRCGPSDSPEQLGERIPCRYDGIMKGPALESGTREPHRHRVARVVVMKRGSIDEVCDRFELPGPEQRRRRHPPRRSVRAAREVYGGAR